MRFTDEQQMAIDVRDKNVLVSAAAGSGKTAVLVERIIKILISEQSHIDNMLIVTFTNAAAAEIKAKIIKAIKKEMLNNPDKRAQLNSELDSMYRAYISTFHSFAMRIIKEYFYTIDMEPNFKICDEAQTAIMQNEAINELFEEGFSRDDIVPGASFRHFLKLYSSDRSEEALMVDMVSNYNEIRSIPYYFDWADSKIAELDVDENNLKGSKVLTAVKGQIREELKTALNQMNEAIAYVGPDDVKSIHDKLLIDKMMINNMYMASEDILSSEFEGAFSDYSFQRLTPSSKDKEQWKTVKEDVAGLRDSAKSIVNKVAEKYLIGSIKNQMMALSKTKEYAEYYVEMLKLFEVRFDEKKKKMNLLDFSDIEHIALNILKDDEIAKTLSERFDFIFIDEYQDTNYIQETLISRISGGDNLFKVGDVKQSIYGFRQAEPQIFIDTRKEYSKKDEDKSTVIDLNKNFRSKGNIITFINEIFELLMEGYDNSAKLYEGVKYEGEFNDLPEVHMVNTDKEKENDADYYIDKGEVEARATARIIKRQLGKPFHDSANGIVRELEPKDVVILMRSTSSNGEKFYKALQNEGIQSYVTGDDGYFDTIEVNTVIELLSLLDNMKQDVPLISVLYSEMFGFTTEELGRIKAFSKIEKPYIAYYEAFNIYINRDDDDYLRDKCKDAMDKLSAWKNMAALMPIDKFIWRIMVESNYYIYIGAMPKGKQRQANLRALVDKAIDYQNAYMGSIHNFVKYLKILKTRNVRIGDAKIFGEEDNLVRIMTIHKSKGLEFPCVVLAGIGKKLNGNRRTPVVLINKELGIGISEVNDKKKYKRKTILQKVITDCENKKDYEEELRVLYVAMTRAREKLILIGLSDDYKDLETGVDKGSYLNIMGNRLHGSNCKYTEEYGFLKSAGNNISQCKRICDFTKALGDIAITESYDDIAKRLSFKYDKKTEEPIKSKYSVSELNGSEQSLSVKSKLLMKNTQIAVPEFAREEKVIKGTDVGNAYHKIMEAIDFSKAGDEAYLKTLTDELIKKGMIEETVFSVLKLERISGFISSDIGKRCVSAYKDGQLFREHPFTMIKNIKGEDVLVQGIIDCYFYEGDEVILLDYKSNAAKEDQINEIKSRYGTQMELYKEALENGLDKNVKEAYLYLFSSNRLVNM